MQEEFRDFQLRLNRQVLLLAAIWQIIQQMEAHMTILSIRRRKEARADALTSILMAVFISKNGYGEISPWLILENKMSKFTIRGY